MRRPVRVPLLITAVVLVVDRLTKVWALDFVGVEGRSIEVTGFFNLVRVWNTGVSFSLFQSDSEIGRWALTILPLLVVAGLVYWVRNSRDGWLWAAVGFVTGGALGNVIDRVTWGAVADFVDIHAFGYHWPAFNVADASIVGGVAYIALEGLFKGRQPSPGGSNGA